MQEFAENFGAALPNGLDSQSVRRLRRKMPKIRKGNPPIWAFVLKMLESSTQPVMSDSSVEQRFPDLDVTESATDVKYGERLIAAGELITFPNPRPGRRYQIHITLPEFTCKCPFSGYPDFATIQISYVPDQRVVELKALKLYINSYRDRYISHEESMNQILDDFVTACDPLEVKLKGDFAPRGNVHTVIEVAHQKSTLPVEN
jgi:7-cyano-7-deazaguanine reductase